MKELYTEIEIEAPIERVWQILTDFTSFPDWNPFIRQIKGELQENKQLIVCIQPSGGDRMRFQPTVIKVQPNSELRWRGHFLIPGLFDGEHIFVLEPLDKNRVRFSQREIFKGLLVLLLSKKLDTETKRGFEEMNLALKRRVEQN
ncbi:SRPBCC domain-containing protein [Pleurocapsales cyanobacterium LEGE 06147]|nr:SRPBCC domain-containing protein [Pleurocapsales cyanobacterium LEGE 06147]